MEFFFFAKKLLALLVLPPVGPLLFSAVGLAILRRRPALGKALAWAGVLALSALSLPIVSWSLGLLLQDDPVLDLRRAQQAQAVIIIGGGIRPEAVEYGGDTLSALSLERLRYGARIARQTGLPVLVSGGAVHQRRPEAELMKAVLEEEYRVAVRWVEAQSRNTRENAVLSASLLRQSNVRRAVLVAHGFDMRRARAEFEAAGIEVISAPTGLPAWTGETIFEWLPNMGALRGSYYALYELFANAARYLGLNK
jgi:uncharacterized SAM-binding protein YcdF (DUF218 family)